MAAPATTIAVARVVAQASTANATDSRRVAEQLPPGRGHQQAVDPVRSIELVGDPGHVGAARERQPRPQRHCDTTSSGNVVTRPAMAMPMPITTWPITDAEAPADRVGEHPTRHLGHQHRHALEHADEHEFERLEVRDQDEVGRGTQPVAAGERGAAGTSTARTRWRDRRTWRRFTSEGRCRCSGAGVRPSLELA